MKFIKGRIIISTVSSKNLLSVEKICTIIENFLEEHKAEDIARIDIRNKSAIADFMIIASGRSQRHIQSTSELLKQHLNQAGIHPISIEGTSTCDWVLLDAGHIIIHLFRPEVRSFYNLEKMWGLDLKQLKNSSEL